MKYLFACTFDFKIAAADLHDQSKTSFCNCPGLSYLQLAKFPRTFHQYEHTMCCNNSHDKQGYWSNLYDIETSKTKFSLITLIPDIWLESLWGVCHLSFQLQVTLYNIIVLYARCPRCHPARDLLRKSSRNEVADWDVQLINKLK